MDDVTPPRIGVLRHDRPSAVVAHAEARVIGHELTRRLGALTLDLRVDGETIGPWRPVEHAAWPGGVDVAIDLDEIVADVGTPLTALFARTVDPEAADVRRRMLIHLGSLPVGRFDDAALAAATRIPLRPTDLWLLVTGADHVEVDDQAVRALAGAPLETLAAVDARFDALADRLRSTASVDDAATARLAALTARVGELERELEAARSDAARERLEAVHRLDELVAEQRRLVDRLDRAELAGRHS